VYAAGNLLDVDARITHLYRHNLPPRAIGSAVRTPPCFLG
jgi:hypothetical protein